MDRRTQDITIWDEDNDYSAIVDSDGDLYTKSKLWDGINEVNVITDNDSVNRLATETIIKRKSQPIRRYVAFSTAQNKINYTVPAGKRLFIVTMFASQDPSSEGKLAIEFQENTVGFAGFGISGESTSTFQLTAPAEVPYGSFSAGVTIRASRVFGDTGRRWNTGFVGFLEDV